MEVIRKLMGLFWSSDVMILTEKQLMCCQTRLFRKLTFTSILLIIYYCVSCFVFAASGQKVALTEAERIWLKTHPNITLGYTDSFEPEVIVNPDGTYRGIQVDILAELNKRLDTNIGLQIDPIPKVIKNAKNKEIDGILSLHPGYADELGLLKSKSYFTSYPTVFARKDVAFNSVSDFAGKRVAVIDKLFFSRQIIEQYGNKATVLKVQDAKEGLSCVARGQADYFLGASLNAYLITKYQLFDLATQYVFYDYPINQVVGIRSDWPELVSILDKGLSSFSKEEIENTVTKWVHLPTETPVVNLTAGEQTWLSQHKTVRTRLGEHQPLLYLKDSKAVGMSIDYLNLISQMTGMTFKVEEKPSLWSDALQRIIKHEDLDLMPSINPTPEREKRILFTNAYYSSPRFIFIRDDAPFVSGMESLSERKVAVIKGYVVHKYIAEKYPDIQLVVCKNNRTALEAVSKNEAFAMIGDILSVPFMLNDFGISNIKAVAPSGMPDHVIAMGVRDDWPELRSILNKALDAIPADQKAAIKNKWSTVRVEHGIRIIDVAKWVLSISAVALCLVFFFYLWNRTLKQKVSERTSELTESEQRFRATFEQAAVGIAHVSPEGKFLRINQKFCDIAGYTHDEMLNLNFQDITYPDDLSIDIERVNQLLEGELNTYSMEKRYVRKNGELVWVHLTVSLIRDKADQPQCFVSVVKDISERKNVQEALEASEERFRDLMEQSSLSIQIHSPDGRLLNSNPAYAKLYALNEATLAELYEKYNVLHDEQAERKGLMPFIEKVFLGEGVTFPEYEYDGIDTLKTLNFKNPISRKCWVGTHGYPIKDKNGKVTSVVIMSEDITERRQAEDEIHKQNIFLQSIFNDTNVLFGIIDVEPSGEFRYVFMSQALENVTGLKTECVLGLTPDEIVPNISPEAAAHFKQQYSQCVDSGEMLSYEESVNIADRDVWWITTLTPVKDDSGKVIRIIASTIDISKGKQAEEEISRLRDEYAHIGRVSAMGELTASLSHELRQPLAAIRSNAQAALRFLTGNKPNIDELHEVLKDIIADNRRADDVIGKIRKLMRKSEHQFTELNMVGLVQDILPLVTSHEAMRKISLQLKFDKTIPLVAGDRIQIQQVILNLILNSTEALLDKKAGSRLIVVQAYQQDDHVVTISVRDNGRGIDAEVMPHLFEAFYTTKQEGLGMGLAICRSIIQEHGGHLWTENNPDGGATFYFTIPIAKESRA